MSERRTPSPQTLIFEKGYDPQRSEGAAVPPVFRTSTFIFKRAVDGKRAFELAYGLRPREQGESPALIYTRVNNPNSEILEDRVTAWDGAEAAALFSSGMGAISSTCLTLLRPGDTMLFSDPIYGGTEYLFRKLLPEFGIHTVPFPARRRRGGAGRAGGGPPRHAHHLPGVAGQPDHGAVRHAGGAARGRPALHAGAAGAGARRQHLPRPHLLAAAPPRRRRGALLRHQVLRRPLGPGGRAGHGRPALINQVRATRTILGSMSDPDTAWLIHRSLGTLQLRMEKQQENTVRLVELLRKHPKVKRVYYPGLPEMGERQVALWKQQCSGAGSLVSFDVQGGEAEAYRVLDAVRHMRLAVSLGGIETLVEHPWSMTHADMTPEEKLQAGFGQAMIRLSVGLEDPADLVDDLERALETV